MLHIINKSPFTHDALSCCLRFCTANDQIILIEDAVYAAQKDTLLATIDVLLEQDLPVYALRQDVQARGLIHRVSPKINLVDYSGFVDLACQATTSQSWL